MTTIVARGNALHIPMRDRSVDCIVTSPPYFALRDYKDGGVTYDGQLGAEPSPAEFLESLWAFTSDCWRVLKPGGSLFVNLDDKYAERAGPDTRCQS